VGDPRRSVEILLARSVTASRSRKTPDHLSAIQPPTVAHLTVRNRLWPARHLGVFAQGGEPPQLYRLSDGSAESSLWHLFNGGRGQPRLRQMPPREPSSAGARQRRRFHRARGTFRRRGPCLDALSRGLRGAPPPLADGGDCRTGFTGARKLRLDLHDVAFASAFRPRAPLRFLQIDVSMSTTTDHLNIPDRRMSGRDGCLVDCKLPFNRDNRRRYARSGVETPNLDTLHRDCSRRGLRPNPDRSGHLVSRKPLFALSGETRGRERHRRRRTDLHGKRDVKGRAAVGFREET